MGTSGFNHVGLATRDMDGTIAFYQDLLGFEIVRYDEIEIEEGGSVRHVFMDCGNGQLISFIAPENVPGFPAWDTAIYSGLDVPRGFYHYAFNAISNEELMEKKAALEAKGLKVWYMDHDWARSIYFDDPVNGIALEYCTMARTFNEDDRTRQIRFRGSIKMFTSDLEAKAKSEEARFEMLRDRAASDQPA